MNNIMRENYTLLCDFYELTMGNGYFLNGYKDRITFFDVFFRQVPDNGGFAIACGLQQIVEYIQNLEFTENDIEYLRSKGVFDKEFLKYLRGFRFTGDIYAISEGTPIFPGEPILTVRAPAIEAQFIETYVLLSINHQSLIATKANRIVRAAKGRPVSEFGSRRAQGPVVQFWERVLPISQDVPVLPAQLLKNVMVFLRVVLWHIPGFRCLMTNTRRLILIAVYIL